MQRGMVWHGKLMVDRIIFWIICRALKTLRKRLEARMTAEFDQSLSYQIDAVLFIESSLQ